MYKTCWYLSKSFATTHFQGQQCLCSIDTHIHLTSRALPELGCIEFFQNEILNGLDNVKADHIDFYVLI